MERSPLFVHTSFQYTNVALGGVPSPTRCARHGQGIPPQRGHRILGVRKRRPIEEDPAAAAQIVSVVDVVVPRQEIPPRDQQSISPYDCSHGGGEHPRIPKHHHILLAEILHQVVVAKQHLPQNASPSR
jgi:hypothetical protein